MSGDPPPSDPPPSDEWLGAPLRGWSSPVSTSAVRPQASGKLALDSFAQALTRCTSSEAIVIVSAWSFNNVPTSAGYTNELFTQAAGRGTRVRALLAKFQSFRLPGGRRFAPGDTPDNRDAVDFFNRLPNGAAILDGWALHHILPIWRELGRLQLGIHHMKAWVVYDGSRLTAWIGGVDLNNNRTPDQGPNYWHDVQAELEGPAAGHIYGLLRERWNSHPSVQAPTALPPLSAQPPGEVQQRARIVTTFGNPTAYSGLGPPGWSFSKVKPYPFAPTGSTSYRELVLHCITQAKKFIYIEDQYLVDEDIGKRLGAAMSQLAALIIVMPCTDGRVIPATEAHADGLTGEVSGVSGELHQAWERRKRFISHLAPHQDKVAVVTRERYVHAKLWIFDDTVAIIGSANINRRGYAHDSEGAVAFKDVPPAATVPALRIDLWNRHLGDAAPSASVPAEQALRIWQAPPANTKVIHYNPNAGTDKAPVPAAIPNALKGWFWDTIVDPDCPPGP